MAFSQIVHHQVHHFKKGAYNDKGIDENIERREESCQHQHDNEPL
jgi:hypothetical protein